MFGRLVAAAALAGLVSGLLLTAVQQFSIAPMIRDAEVREDAAALAKVPATQPAEGHSHDGWSPANARQRLVATALSNIVVATGFALLLGAVMTLRGASGLKQGLMYGAAGYAAMFVAPSLGLPPELPGTESAALAARQLWWAGTVIAAGAGMALTVLCKAPWLRALGIALLIAPHAIGAPQVAAHSSIHPAQAALHFVVATFVANAALWLALGGVTGYLLDKRAWGTQFA